MVVDIDGDQRSLLAADEDGFEPAPWAVHLPHFDVYVVGFHPAAS